MFVSNGRKENTHIKERWKNEKMVSSLQSTNSTFFDKPDFITVKEEQAIKYAKLPSGGEQATVDLTYAAEKSIHTVVSTNTIINCDPCAIR